MRERITAQSMNVIEWQSRWPYRNQQEKSVKGALANISSLKSLKFE